MADLQGACSRSPAWAASAVPPSRPSSTPPRWRSWGRPGPDRAGLGRYGVHPRLMLPISLSYDTGHRRGAGRAVRPAPMQLLEDITRPPALTVPRPLRRILFFLEPDMDITVPDIGHFIDVPVIEVHVTAVTWCHRGSVITLESDKATLDVPASAAGTSASRHRVGDRVSPGPHPPARRRAGLRRPGRRSGKGAGHRRRGHGARRAPATVRRADLRVIEVIVPISAFHRRAGNRGACGRRCIVARETR